MGARVMALSNWDTLAFGEDGQSCPGEVALRGDAVLEIYKNWVYIRHPSAWFEGSDFTGDVVLQIDSGELEYAGCEIVVARHETQSTCFVFVADHKYSEGPPTHRFFAGIGCSAYLSTLEYMKRHDPEKLALVQEHLDEGFEQCGTTWSDAGTEACLRRGDEYIDVPVYGPGEDPDTFVGVLPEVHAAFLEWLAGVVEEGQGEQAREWLAMVRATSPLRYNQGDAYFAEHVGQGIQGTPIGEQEPTIMERLTNEEAEATR